MKANEIITEGWWDNFKQNLRARLGSETEYTAYLGQQELKQNIDARVESSFKVWAGVVKNLQLPRQPGEDPYEYQIRKLKYLSKAIKSYADDLYKNSLPRGGTRVFTPAFTGDTLNDLKTARQYLKARTKEFFTTINVDDEEPPAPVAQVSSTSVAPAQPAPVAQVSSTSVAPAQPPANPRTAADAARRFAAQKQTNQNINVYVQNVAKTLNTETDRAKKIALTKELINFMADRKGYPEWQNALGTVKAILVRHKAGGNMLRALQNGQRITESWKLYFVNKLLEATGFTWKDVGLVLLQESVTGKYMIIDRRYYKTHIFENTLRPKLTYVHC